MGRWGGEEVGRVRRSGGEESEEVGRWGGVEERRWGGGIMVLLDEM